MSPTADGLGTELGLARMQSHAAMDMRVAPSPFTCGQLARALLMVLTRLLDRIVTRRNRRAWMIECVRQHSGSRLPSMAGQKDLMRA